jgi:4-amino-4-deoxychorismate lyase
MCLLIETIRIADKQLQHIPLHELRMNKSRRELFGACEDIDLLKAIHIPENISEGIYKCRVLYGLQINEISIEPYVFKKISSIKIVRDDTIEYSHKYADRNRFQQLLSASGVDEILIVKNNYITDTSFSNIILSDGEKWHTPTLPLLKGTMREYLLNNKIIFEKNILLRDLWDYKSMRIINAMNTFEDQRDFEINPEENSITSGKNSLNSFSNNL